MEHIDLTSTRGPESVAAPESGAEPWPRTGLGEVRNSRVMFERAKRSLAGGTSSSSRITTTGEAAHPLYIESGSGPFIKDLDGNVYLDFLISYGSAILGHANPLITRALTRTLATGTMFGTCNVPEVELAELITSSVPCADLVRYANSGSEAVQGAVRAARGYTGRAKILKFEGHYHGWADTLAVSSKPAESEVGPYDNPARLPHSHGIPPGVTDDVVVCPWNDLPALRDALDAHGPRLAAVICEPIVANNACTMPLPGFLAGLREECDRRGIVLIFDEVCTGFRTGPGGAQALFGVVPDLAVYSKALGGGLPIAAFAGRRAIMELVGSNHTKHGGTYNGSPLCANAALVTLSRLADPQVTAGIESAGQRVMTALRRAAHDNRVPCTVQGVGAMFQIVFTPGGSPVRQYRDLFAADGARYAALRHELLRRGVHVNPYGLACWFVPAVLEDAHVDHTCAMIAEAFTALR